MVLPDHRTPLIKKTHTSEPVPFAIVNSTDFSKESLQVEEIAFDEISAEKSRLFIKDGFQLMDLFIKGNGP